MRFAFFVTALLVFWQAAICKAQAQAGKEKPRTIITTDGEVDDQDSFIRLLLYSNEFHIAGLIYSSSQWHYKGDGKGTKFISEMSDTRQRYGERTELRWPGTVWMQALIEKYSLVYKNLKKNQVGYPTPQYLRSIIKTGNIDFEGEMDHNTEGSDFIKNIPLDNKPGPVYLQIWGGTNTVARALKSIEDDFKNTPQWKDIYRKVSDKAILYTVLDQDATFRNYVAPNWPDIKVMYNSNQFWCLAYPWINSVPEPLQIFLKGKWFAENIKFNHGPLLSSYLLWGDGQRISGDSEHTQGDSDEAKKNGMEQYSFISEGDSPAFLYLVDVGLRNKADASYGGWGGRMVQSKANPRRWEDSSEAADYNPFTKKVDVSYAQTRWIDVLQNDFAARADWCVSNYNKANHAPLIKLISANTIRVQPGESVRLQVVIRDPDGNKTVCKWWQYGETDSYPGTISIQNAGTANASFAVPIDAKPGETIHIIAEVKDNGIPQLTRYQRLIAVVK